MRLITMLGSSVELCLNDLTISDAQSVRKIMESLSTPASNMVKSLGLQVTPRDYLTLLDSAYTLVESGAGLYHHVLNTARMLVRNLPITCSAYTQP